MIILKIKKWIAKIIKKRINKFNIVLNINKDLTKKQKKVALVYVHYNFTNTLEEIYHTQALENCQIIKAFIDRNYDIDVINCHEENALELVKSIKYDVVFGLGDLFYSICMLNPSAKKIIYTTENYPVFSLKKEKERIGYYNHRKHKKLNFMRSNVYFKVEHFKHIDYAIVMGRKKEFEKLDVPIFDINPTGLINSKFEMSNKKHEYTKYNFLWFGSSGAVHKGLDILYDVFKKRNDVNLYICGLDKKEKKILKINDKKNIIDLGKININSDLFLDLCNKCSFVILPSCSEAMSTSVITCMLHGLIPIVIKENGFEKMGNNCIYLNDFKVEYIDMFITKLVKESNEYLSEFESKAYSFARKNFIIEKFSEDFNNILDNIEL